MRNSMMGVVVAAFAAMTMGSALAEDVPDSEDHPLVGRYEGSEIVEYKHNDFDEAYALKAMNDWTSKVPVSDTDRTGSEWQRMEGEVWAIRYMMPAGRSSLEIYRNYQLSLKEKGFEPIFECTDGDCFTGTHDDLPYQMGSLFDHAPGNSGAYWDHSRYTFQVKHEDDGALYAMIVVGENKGQAVGWVQVVKTKEMETGKIVVKSADEMMEALKRDGRVSLYTLTFDTDKATLKPEADPTLIEINKLMVKHPDLKLLILGHTDNQGGADYNMDLSGRRAASVVQALEDRFAMDPARLKSEGKGLTEPAASNDDEAGRALNRRVELVGFN
jgi:outer membrane protein OmpA-like peptidoglycan-associated protein